MATRQRKTKQEIDLDFGLLSEAEQAEFRTQAMVEVELRRRYGTSFKEFIKNVNPDYQFYKHTDVLTSVLEKVASGLLKRVMIWLPPRHSKSETASRLFPSYYMFKNPKHHIGLNSYSAELAYSLSRKARENYEQTGRILSEEASSVKEWHTEMDGVFWSAGVGGSITGRGFHCFPAWTVVTTNRGLKTIDKISVGDKVLSLNHISGNLEYKPVIAVAPNLTNQLIKLSCGDGQLLFSTLDHMIYSSSENKYKKASEFNVGEYLTTSKLLKNTVEEISLVDVNELNVYDIQVEDNNNFFANGILVHNCGIIDDPIKGAEEANSQLIRDKQWDWYQTTFYTRREPNAAIVIIMCVAEGERVLMADGTWKPIEKIIVGDSVIGYEDQKPVPKKVMATKPQGEDDIVEVQSRSCKLKVNARHPFLVMRGGLKKSAKTQEDVVASRNWDLEWVKAGDLQPGDTVVTIKNLQKTNGHRPSSYVKTKSNHQMIQDDYWLFGFMFGDGWLASTQKRGDTGVCIAKGVYDDLNQKVVSTAEARLGINMYETKYGYYRADNTSAAKWLRSKGFKSGAKIKRVPDWIFKLRPCDKREFLHGFLNADGWLRPSELQETWTTCLANKELVDDLRLLARTCGVKTTKIYEQHGMRFAPNSKVPTEGHFYSARFSFRNNMFEFKTRYKNQNDLGRYFRMEDVESITPCGRSNVYDITVEGAESFVAEGFVVHNTRWHDDDLCGRLLRNETEYPENWHIVNLEAIKSNDPVRIPSTCTIEKDWRKEGQALCPERYDVKELKKIRNAVGETTWRSLYQQRPVAEDGIIWKKAWFEGKTFEKLPVDIVNEGYDWDTAYTKDEGNAASAYVKAGVGSDGNIYVTDMDFKWLEFPEFVTWTMAKRDRPHFIEQKSTGKSVVQSLRKVGMYAQEVKVFGGDKVARAKVATPIVERGKVFVHKNIITRLLYDDRQGILKFPNGTHADLNDAFVQMLNRLRPFTKIVEQVKKKEYESYDDYMEKEVFAKIHEQFGQPKQLAWHQK